MQNNMQYQRTVDEVREAFGLLVQTYQFCTQRTLRKYGLYPGQPALLFALTKAEEENGVRPTQNDVAVMLGVSRASAGVSIRRLEKAGFVKRTQDAADTRCNRIALTKKGKEFARWCEIDTENIFINMLEDFTADERVEVLDILRRMNRGLTNMKERILS